MSPIHWTEPSHVALPLAALGLALLHAALARRSEHLFERVLDLNRERLNVLERGLEAGSGRSRLEALSSQLDAAAQTAVSARRLASWMLVLAAGVASAAMAAALLDLPRSEFAASLQLLWLGAVVLSGLWQERDLARAAAAAEESTAHARRYEFLYVSEMRKRS